MKNAIYEYLETDAQKKEELWETSVFVFDTNVLLNLYRYSAKTRETLLTAIQSLQDRIWIPYQVAYEFMRRRCEIIYETIDRYEKLTSDANTFKKTCQETLRLKKDDLDIVSLDKFVCKWLDEHKEKNVLVTNPIEDPILNNLLVVFDGKVGQAYDEVNMSEIKEDGQKRYEKLIPPGYKDANKKDAISDNNMYGDFIIWKQILDFTKDNNIDVIYVTHDQKEDWWNIVRGKTIGPRVELRKEFIELTKQSFHMYSMNSFIERFDEKRGTKTDQSIIDEVKHFEQESNIRRYRNKPQNFSEYRDVLERKIINLQRSIEKREKVVEQLEKKYKGQEKPEAIQIQVDNTITKIEQLQAQLIIQKQKFMEQLVQKANLQDNGYFSLNS